MLPVILFVCIKTELNIKLINYVLHRKLLLSISHPCDASITHSGVAFILGTSLNFLYLHPIFFFLTKMESASYCKFLASFYKLMRKLDRSTILHTSVCKWFSAFQDSRTPVIIVMCILF